MYHPTFIQQHPSAVRMCSKLSTGSRSLDTNHRHQNLRPITSHQLANSRHNVPNTAQHWSLESIHSSGSALSHVGYMASLPQCNTSYLLFSLLGYYCYHWEINPIIVSLVKVFGQCPALFPVVSETMRAQAMQWCWCPPRPQSRTPSGANACPPAPRSPAASPH